MAVGRECNSTLLLNSFAEHLLCPTAPILAHRDPASCRGRTTSSCTASSGFVREKGLSGIEQGQGSGRVSFRKLTSSINRPWKSWPPSTLNPDRVAPTRIQSMLRVSSARPSSLKLVRPGSWRSQGDERLGTNGRWPGYRGHWMGIGLPTGKLAVSVSPAGN